MTYLPLPRDAQGDIVLPGRVRKTITENFMWSTAMPSWLALTNGTATYSTLATSRGEVAIASAATNGAQASLRTNDYIDLSKVESVWWQLDGFSFDSLGASALFMGVSGTGTGAYLNGQVMKSAGGADTTVPTNLLVDFRKKNIGILLITGTKHVYVTQGQDVMAEVDYSATMVLGQVRPDVAMATQENVAKTIRIARASLTVTTW